MDAATCPVDGATMMPRSRRRLRTALSAVMGLPSASAIWPVRTGSLVEMRAIAVR
jgi:hypothetical protein